MTNEQAVSDAAHWANVIAARCPHYEGRDGGLSDACLSDAFSDEASALLATLQEEGFPATPSAAWALRKAALECKGFGFYTLEYLAQRVTALGKCSDAHDALAVLSFLTDLGYTDPELGPAAFESLRTYLEALSRKDQNAKEPASAAADATPGAWCGTDMGDE